MPEPRVTGNDVTASDGRQLWRAWVVASVVLALLTTIYFADYLFKGKVIYESDSLMVSYATRYYAVSRLQQGEIPHWNPNYYLGYPFLAEGQAGVFDPFTLVMVLFPLSSFRWLYHLLLALRFFLIGIFTFGWLRTETENFHVSLLGATTLPFSGFFISHIFHPHLVAVVGWTPLLLWLWKIREKRPSRRRYAEAFLVLVCAWQILMGHFPGLALSWSALGFYVLFNGASQFLKSEKGKGLVEPLLALLRICGFSALLTAFQWLPTLSETRDIGRSLIPPVDEGFLYLWQWVLLVKPNFLGDFLYEKGGYIGVLPLIGVLAILMALVVPKWRRFVPGQSVTYVMLALWFLWFTLGPYSFFYSTLARVPPFNLLRYPSRYLSDFGIFALAGVCLFVVELARHKTLVRRLLPMLVILQTADVFLTGYNYTIPAPGTVVDQEPERISVIRQNVGPGQRAFSTGFRYFQTYRYPDFLQMEPGEGTVPSEILAFFTANRYNYPVISFFHQTTLLQRRFVGFIREMQTKQSSELLDFLGVSAIVMPSDYMVTAIQAEDYAEVYRSRSGYDIVRIRKKPVSKARFVQDYVIVPPQKTYQWVQKQWFKTKKIVLSRDKNILDYMLSARFDFANQVLFEAAPNIERKNESQPAKRVNGPCTRDEMPQTADIQWLSDQPGRMRFCVLAPTDGFVIVAEQFHRNWAATIDGKHVPVLRGNYVFLTIPISEGSHEVRFEYRPKEFTIGLWVAALGFALFLSKFVLPGNGKAEAGPQIR